MGGEIEPYWLLFIDNFVGNLAINPNRGFIIDVMKSFGYDKTKILLFTACSTLLAIFCNYILGKILCKVLYSFSSEKSRVSFYKTSYIISKYSFLLLPLVIIPFFGKFIPVVAGVYGTGLIKTSIICTIYQVIIYAYFLF